MAERNCSPEMADRIVRLLLSTTNDDVVLSTWDSRPKPTSPKPVAPVTRKHRNRKCSPAICQFILQNRGVNPVNVTEQVEAKFGIQVSVTSVYKVWKFGETAPLAYRGKKTVEVPVEPVLLIAEPEPPAPAPEPDPVPEIPPGWKLCPCPGNCGRYFDPKPIEEKMKKFEEEKKRG